MSLPVEICISRGDIERLAAEQRALHAWYSRALGALLPAAGRGADVLWQLEALEGGVLSELKCVSRLWALSPTLSQLLAHKWGELLGDCHAVHGVLSRGLRPSPEAVAAGQLARRGQRGRG